MQKSFRFTRVMAAVCIAASVAFGQNDYVEICKAVIGGKEQCLRQKDDVYFHPTKNEPYNGDVVIFYCEERSDNCECGNITSYDNSGNFSPVGGFQWVRGNMKNGKRYGKWEEGFGFHIYAEINFNNGKKQGEYKSFDDEAVTIGNYDNDKKQGVWKTFFDDKLIKTEIYKDGTLIKTVITNDGVKQ